MSEDQVLEAFGEYWVLYTGRGAFGSLMSAAGSTLREFLANLDNMHMRLGFTMPHLRPPTFRCYDEGATSLRVFYYSDRAGLAPMVVGLIKGLGIMLQERIEVESVLRKSDEVDHDEFLVRFV